MNQSSLSVTDVGKSAALLSSGAGSAKQSGEVAESESFLSKLGAIFKSEEKVTQSSEGETEAQIDGKQPRVEAQQAVTDAESADAVTELELDGSEEVDAGEAEGVTKAKAEADNSTAVASSTSADDAVVKAAVSAESEPEKAADAMKSGNQLLERLDESSQALQKPSGKGLPPQETAQQAGDSDQVKHDVLAKYIQQPDAVSPPAEGEPVAQAVSASSVSPSATASQPATVFQSTPGSPLASATQDANADIKPMPGANTQHPSGEAAQLAAGAAMSTAQVFPGQAEAEFTPQAMQKAQSIPVGTAVAASGEAELTPEELQQVLSSPSGSGEATVTQKGIPQPVSQAVDTPLPEWHPQQEHAEHLSSAVIQGAVIDPKQAEAESAVRVNPLIWDMPQDIEADAGVQHSGHLQPQDGAAATGVDPQQLAALQAQAGEQPIAADGEWHELMSAQQAGGGVELGKQAVDLSKLQSEQPVANHQLRNQQLQQQMVQAQNAAHQQSQAVEKQAVAQAVTPTPTAAEFNAANLHAVNPAQVSVPQAGKEPGLNAALAATKAAGAIKGMQSTKGEAREAELSQQLASLAGQQGIQQTQARAEMQQAASIQSPLQLSRDMAGDELAERVQMMMSKNLKNVDIRLDPPELGRMQIRMTMHNDIASVQFTVANQQARDMVEHAMPRLREMLAQQGLQLADTSVQQQNAGQQRQYTAGNGSGGSHNPQGQVADDGLNLDESINLDVNIASKDDGISYYA